MFIPHLQWVVNKSTVSLEHCVLKRVTRIPPQRYNIENLKNFNIQRINRKRSKIHSLRRKDHSCQQTYRFRKSSKTRGKKNTIISSNGRWMMLVKSPCSLHGHQAAPPPHARVSERVSLKHACGISRPVCIKRAPLFLPRQRLPGCKTNGGKNSADQLWLFYLVILYARLRRGVNKDILRRILERDEFLIERNESVRELKRIQRLQRFRQAISVVLQFMQHWSSVTMSFIIDLWFSNTSNFHFKRFLIIYLPISILQFLLIDILIF